MAEKEKPRVMWAVGFPGRLSWRADGYITVNGLRLPRPRVWHSTELLAQHEAAWFLDRGVRTVVLKQQGDTVILAAPQVN